MDRTNAPGNVDRRYIDENRNIGVQGTAIIAADRNAVQEELIHLIEGGGLAPNAGDETQLLQSVLALGAQQALAMPPVGTIWMYDGAGWVDNVTLPGWYACVPENEDGGVNGLSFGIRSMVDRFVVGGSPATVGTVGGANSYQLTVDQLPAHNHAIDHDHAVFTSAGESNNHTHEVNGRTDPIGNHSHSVSGNIGGGGGGSNLEAGNGRGSNNFSKGTSSAGSHDHGLSITSGGRSAGHTHQIDVPLYTGPSGATGAGAAIDNRPAHYTMIFIRKCV